MLWGALKAFWRLTCELFKGMGKVGVIIVAKIGGYFRGGDA